MVLCAIMALVAQRKRGTITCWIFLIFLGPVMVGPSSSHTAGAVRIGSMARTLLGDEPVEAKIHLHGSFAETGPGHGTDRAWWPVFWA